MSAKNENGKRGGKRVSLKAWICHQSLSASSSAVPRITQWLTGMSVFSLTGMTKLDEWPVVASTLNTSKACGGNASCRNKQTSHTSQFQRAALATGHQRKQVGTGTPPSEGVQGEQRDQPHPLRSVVLYTGATKWGYVGKSAVRIGMRYKTGSGS